MVPAGSAFVRNSGWPAAGPVMTIGVSPVMRRASGDSTTSQVPPFDATSITEMPWLLSDFWVFSALQLASPSGLKLYSVVYSWLMASRPRKFVASAAVPMGKYHMPSWPWPAWTACSAAVLEASSRNCGPEGTMGSPHA